MSLDLQVAYPQLLVELNSVRLVKNFTPPLLEIRSKKFGTVDAVFINDVQSPNFVLVDRYTLYAEIPSIVVKQTLGSVKVVANEPSFAESNYVRFRISDMPRGVSGIDRLAQLFLKLLLTTPGTDIFNQGLGGGVLKMIGKSTGAGQGGEVIADFTIAVERVAGQIRTMQAKKRLPPDEKLLSAKVIGARFDRGQSMLLVSLNLTSQAGNTIPLNVVT